MKETLSAISDLETYEPYAEQMMELTKSALYLKVGSIGFEQIGRASCRERV